MSMNRDYNKLVDDYQTRFYSAPPRQKLCCIFADDYFKIIEAAKETAAQKYGSTGLDRNALYLAIDIALQAGIEIGYTEGKRLDAKNRRKERKAAK